MEAGTTRLELPEQSVYDENVPNTRKVSHLTSRLEELSSKPHLPTNAAPIPIERWTKILRSATIALVFCGVAVSVHVQKLPRSVVVPPNSNRRILESLHFQGEQ
jgi:hypothetical protein